MQQQDRKRPGNNWLLDPAIVCPVWPCSKGKVRLYRKGNSFVPLPSDPITLTLRARPPRTGTGTLRTDPGGRYRYGTISQWRYRQRGLRLSPLHVPKGTRQGLRQVSEGFRSTTGGRCLSPASRQARPYQYRHPQASCTCNPHTLCTPYTTPLPGRRFFKNGLGFSPNPDYSQHFQTAPHPFPFHNPIRTAPGHYPVLCMSNRPLR